MRPKRGKKTTVPEIPGVVFDSKIEAEGCRGLWALQRAKQISQLQFHPEFKLIVNGVQICTYKPDAVYRDADGLHVVDFKDFYKSKKTGKLLPLVNREFGIKCKLMRAIFSLEVEVR